jgi:hypothetical protein
MYCVQCGTASQARQSFCAGCGRSVAIGIENRLAVHLRPLAILWFVISAIRMIPGLFLVTLFSTVAGFLPAEVPGFVLWILQVVGFVWVAIAGIGVVAGWGLLERRPWARMLTIVLGCFGLLEVPFGTALGIYTLWVLLPAEAEVEFRQTPLSA